MQAACRIHGVPPRVGWSRARCPVQDPWNGDCGVSPNLIGVRSDLFEHVELIFIAQFAHALEYADIPTRNVRHTHAENRFKSIRADQRRIPSMRCPPVMANEDGILDAQAVKQPNQVACRMQRCIERRFRRSRTVAIAAHIWSNSAKSGRCDGSHLPAPGIRSIWKPVTEQYSRSFSLLGDVQGNAVCGDVILFKHVTIVSSETFRSGHFPRRQVRARSRSTGEDSAVRDGWRGNKMLHTCFCNGRQRFF